MLLQDNSTPDRLRVYVDSLADVGAAGLAVEGPRLGEIPAELVDEARLRRFPLIELTEVVRFVDVTRAINSRLVAASVRELQFNDEVTHTLAAALPTGDFQQMVTALGTATRCSITVRSLAGAVIAAVDVAGARPRSYARVVSIESDGVTVAVLEVIPSAGVDLQMVAAVCRRAPEPLALALLRLQPMTRSDRQVREVFRLLERTTQPGRSAAMRADDARALAEVVRGLGLDAKGLFVAVVALSVDGPPQTTELAEVLRSDDRPVLSEVRDGVYRAIVRHPVRSDRPELAASLLERLRSTALPRALRIGVTDPTDDLAALGTPMRVALTAARTADERSPVRAARDVAVQHLLAEADGDAVASFVEAVLGPLLRVNRSTELLRTLVTVNRTGSRVAAAAVLNIHRQTMYQRLARIEAILGRPLDGADGSRGALLVAAELALAQR